MSTFSAEMPGIRILADEYVAVNFRLWHRSAATRRNNWLLALPLLAVSTAAQWWGRVPNGATRWSSPGLLALGLAYAGLRPLLVRYALRRNYTGSAAMQVPIAYHMTSSALSGKSTLGQFTVPWAALLRAVWVRPDWLLLYPTDIACYYLDLRRLPPGSTPAGLAQLLAEHQVPQLEE